MHSDDSYQIFEIAKKSPAGEGSFGIFALNTAEIKDVKIWQPELVLEKYAPQMLFEKRANEMDPNLILIRLGNPLTKDNLLDKSAPISTVQDQEIFSVSYRRARYEKKRDAHNYTKLNRETNSAYFSTLDQELELAQKSFDEKFEAIFLSSQQKDGDAKI